MSDTPRTDAMLLSSDGYPDLPDAATVLKFCRTLERELAEAKAAHALANELHAKASLQMSQEIEAERRAREEAERDAKHYANKYEMVMAALADSDGDATGVIIAFQKRAEQAEAMYAAQCAGTDEWAEKYRAEVERKADATLLARCAELEAIAASANERVAAAQNLTAMMQRRMEQAEARVKEYAKGIVDLSKTMLYLVGIAERGEGRTILPEETPEAFVLGYVKRIEARVKELEVDLELAKGAVMAAASSAAQDIRSIDDLRAQLTASEARVKEMEKILFSSDPSLWQEEMRKREDELRAQLAASEARVKELSNNTLQLGTCVKCGNLTQDPSIEHFVDATASVGVSPPEDITPQRVEAPHLIDDLRAQLAAAQKDAERLDYLSTQYVVVRTPARYGSFESFSGSPIEEELTWNIRAAIDAARGAQK